MLEVPTGFASVPDDEDWTRLDDPLQRRRVQNRLAQRNYRSNLKRRLERLERAVKARPQLTEPPTPLNSNMPQRAISHIEVQAVDLDLLSDLSQANPSNRRVEHGPLTLSTQMLSPVSNKQPTSAVSRISPTENLGSSKGGVDVNMGLTDLQIPTGHLNEHLATTSGKSTLHMAVESQCLGMVSLVIEQGVSVNIQDDFSQSPLHLAIENGFVDMVKVLIENGANVDKPDVWGQTSLHAAAKLGMDSALQSLLVHTKDIDARNSNGATALHCAIIHGHENAARILLRNGADLSGSQ